MTRSASTVLNSGLNVTALFVIGSILWLCVLRCHPFPKPIVSYERLPSPGASEFPQAASPVTGHRAVPPTLVGQLCGTPHYMAHTGPLFLAGPWQGRENHCPRRRVHLHSSGTERLVTAPGPCQVTVLRSTLRKGRASPSRLRG